MNFTSVEYSIDPSCQYGDHTWRGGSICVLCGKRLHCACGQFIREDSIERHLKVCPSEEAVRRDELEKLNARMG
jgi:hypothetical protein